MLQFDDDESSCGFLAYSCQTYGSPLREAGSSGRQKHARTLCFLSHLWYHLALG